MPATTAPTAKARILTALAARPALASVQRTWGSPVEDEDTAGEMIFLGRVRGAGEWRTLGAGKRHESYTVELRVVVLQYGDDEQATEERAFALLDEVSAALAANWFLAAGGTQLLYKPAAIESWEQANTPTPDQWGAQIIAQVRCEAMFTP